MPRVELHGYTASGARANGYRSDIDRAIDVTPFVRRLRFSHRTTAPWETLTVELAIPIRSWFHVMPGRPLSQVAGRTLRTPETGFWVVVKSPDANGPNGESTLAWGRCVVLRGGMVRNGLLNETIPLTLECTSWLDLLQRSQIALSAGRGWGREGFVYRLQTWASRAAALLQTLGTREPGVIFERLWRSLVHVTLPNTLAAAADEKPLTIGQEIPVLFDSETTIAYAPLRANQHMDVPGYAINSFATFRQPGGSLWEMFAHTFGADPNVVEVFPSLEWPCYLPAGQDGNAVPAYTRIGKALGSQPVLIYRLKPYVLVPLNQQALQRLTARNVEGARNVPVTASQELGAFQTVASADLPVDVKWYEFTPREVLEFMPTWSDDDRINCVSLLSPVQPQSQIELFGLMGTPQVNDRSVSAHGFRQYKVDWPFLPATIPDDDPTERDTLTRRIDSLTEAAYTILAGGESHFRATVQTLYKPWVRAGHWMSLQLTEATVDLPAKNVTAYIEGATHEVLGEDGLVVSASTSLDLVRGTLDEDAGYYLPIPVGGGSSEAPSSSGVPLAPDVPPDVVFDGKPATPTKKAETTALPAGYITEHFKWSELDPLGARTPEVAARLKKVAALLELIRSSVGKPVSVTGAGGYQPDNAPGWPPRKPTSQHRKGLAADIRIAGAQTPLFAVGLALWTSGAIKGLGFYDGFMHVDLRSGKKARWDERTSKTPVTLPSGGTSVGSLTLDSPEEQEESSQAVA